MDLPVNGKDLTGHFAIQGHNPGMRVEAKDLFYKSLDKKK